MAHAQLETVVRHIRRLVAGDAAKDRPDWQLLHDFSVHQDQTAFASLVRRHGGMVLGVCQHVLRHFQDAEDAFQATFLVLARNAGAIRKREAVASWLHGVAYRTAMRAKRDLARRRLHESQAKSMASTRPHWDLALQELQAVVDEEVQGLPEKYQAPFVLCCLEAKSKAEAALELGWKVGTVSSRLAQARKLLQSKLARRGITLSAVMGAAAILPQAGGAAVPRPLVKATIEAALTYAAGKSAAAGTISAEVAALAEGAMRKVLLTKYKIATALLLCLSLAAGGTRLLIHRTLAAQLPAAQEPQPPGKPTAKEPVPTAAHADLPKPEPALAEKGDAVTVSGRVVDPDGKPFAGAKLYLWIQYNREKPVPAKVRTMSGPDGRFHLTFSKQDIADIEEGWVNARAQPWRHALILAAAPGYGAGWADIAAFEKGAPALQLVKDDIPVKGRVRDLQGRPVAHAIVQVKNIGNLFRPAWAGLPGKAATDQDGRFTMTGIGRGREAALRIAAPAIELQVVGVNTGTTAGASVDVIAGPCKPIEGTVRARDTGKPLSGALLYAKHADFNTIQDDPHGVQAVTDDQGRYRLVGLPKSNQYEITVYPRSDQGYLPATRQIGGSESLKPLTVDFALRRGVTVRFRMIDKETRQPVRGLVQYTLSSDNPLWAEAILPYNPEFVLPPRVWFDAHIPDRNGFIQFVAYPGRGAIFARAGWGDHPYLKARLDPDDEKKGYYPLNKGDPNNGFLDIFDGYRVIDTDKIDEPLTFDIEFTRGRTLKGTLIGPESKPVTGAMAYGVTFDASAIRPDMLRETPLVSQVLKTDAFTALGLFPKEPRTLSFAHKDRKLIGYVIVHGTEDGPLAVRLEPWGAVAGRLVDEQGKALAGVQVRLHYPDLPRPGMLPQETEFKTDEQGRFRVESLLPGLKHELTLSSDPKNKLTLAIGDKLKALSAGTGEVKNLGNIPVKVVSGK